MGSRAEAPPMPMHEALFVPEQDLTITMLQRESNWLQGLEGDIDTSHFGFLHAGHVKAEDFEEGHPARHTVANRAPEYKVDRDRMGHDVWRSSARSQRKDALADGAFLASVLDADAECRFRRSCRGEGVGSDGRYPHDADLDLWRPGQRGDLLDVEVEVGRQA